MPPKQTKSAKDKEKEQEKANALYMHEGRSIKDKSDDRFESIIADCSDGTELGRNHGVKWQKAHQAHAELRMTLVKKGAWDPEKERRMGATPSRRPPSRSAEAVAAAPHAGSVAAAAAAFFPGDWWRALTSDPLAALIVDAMAGAICDALLDACIATLEEEKESAQLAVAGPGAASGSASAAASAPNLQSPLARRQLSMTQPAGVLASSGHLPSKVQLSHQVGDEFGSLSTMSRSTVFKPPYCLCPQADSDEKGFCDFQEFLTLTRKAAEEEESAQLALAGPGAASGSARLSAAASAPNLASPLERRQLSRTLPAGGLASSGHLPSQLSQNAADDFGSLSRMTRSSSDFASCRYHVDKSYTKTSRIEHAAAIQRSRRSKPLPPASLDQRKFIWPMAATNFPKEYDLATRKQPVKKGRGSDQAAQQAHGLPKDNERWLLDIGNDGKTKFPYSLALHKAFLESQPDAVLKEKALKIAPLRMTGTW